jgi:hypothetical protein
MFEFDVLSRGEKLWLGFVMVCFGFILWVIDVIDSLPYMKGVLSIFPIVGITVCLIILMRSVFIEDYLKNYKE